MAWYNRTKTSPSETRSWDQDYWVNQSLVSETPVSVSWTPRQMFGIDIPDFHRRLVSGELLPHTQFSQIAREHYILPARYEHTDSGQNDVYLTAYSFAIAEGHFLDQLSHVADTAYHDAMVQSSASKIVNAGWDVGTAVSEFPSLKRQFKKVGRSIKRLYRNGSYNNHTEQWLRKNKRESVSFDDLWLEGRYGWRTLAYDIRDLNNAIQEFDSKRRIWTERSGYSYTESTTTDVSKQWSAGLMQSTLEDVTEHSIRGAVAALIKPARFIVDPLQTAWELTPWSFVADWVLNVGDALAAHKLIYLSDSHTASWGVKSVTNRTVTTKAIKEPATVSQNYQETYRGEYELVYRNPAEISITPSFTGRKITSDLVLDLRALIKGGKPTFSRR